ncbi:MAG TPA: hypothetical protein VHZ76_00685 [Gammaproteobacteria bacterium]|jgi:hypothetical protein|nr:hypothetical protein [Gammaproteobacteria bacterium]
MTTTGNLPILNQQPSLLPITSLVGTSVNYANVINETFTAANQIIGQMFNRSNATVAMTDALPVPNVSNGGIGPLPNGWNIRINNIDASAAITLTPISPATINGSSSLSIAAGHTSTIITDGTNYFTLRNPA